MDIEQLHPELRRTYSRIPTLPLHNSAVRAVLSFVMDLVPNKVKPVPGLDIEDKMLEHCGVRIYRPRGKASTGALMWIHGGGFIIGNTGLNDRECSGLALDLGLLVVSVNYRLAPKNPFPAALDDCFDAWQFMQASAEQWKIDRTRMVIAGQSAGGCLAAATVQRIADTSNVQPAAQILWYPMLDDRTAANAKLDDIKHRFFNNKSNRGAWRWYLGQSPGMNDAPAYAVPARRGDLKGLPPTWIAAGELDLFREEDRAYAERLKASGVPCELYVAPGAPHAFDALAPTSSVTKNAVEDSYRFLRDQLHL